MRNQLTITVLVVLFYLVSGIEFNDCGSQIGRFTSIDVGGCDTTKSACVLHKNTTASIGIEFELVSEDECPEVKAVVHGVIMGIPMPFPLKNPDGCTNSGLSCPIKKGQSYKYEATLAVLKSYPKVKVDVKWELINSDNATIVCVLIPAKIE